MKQFREKEENLPEVRSKTLEESTYTQICTYTWAHGHTHTHTRFLRKEASVATSS